MTLAWLQLDVRRRWRPLVVLALLVAVSGGLVLTAVAGARRGESALQRLVERGVPATVDVAPLQPGFDWGPVQRLPEVEAMVRYVDQDFTVEGIPAENLPIAQLPQDDGLLRTLERPVLLAGRLAEPDRVDEVVVTARFASSYGKGVGDRLTAVLATPEQAAQQLSISVPDPAGPRLVLRIVGVVRSAWFSDGPRSHGVLIPTAALLRTYRANLVNESTWSNALVRLRGGQAAVPAFRAHLAEATGHSDLWLQDQQEKLHGRQQAARFEARWLLAFAAAGFLAALVLVGQAVARHVLTGLGDLRVLRAIGMVRAQMVAAAVAGPLAAGLAGGCVAVALAVLASRWFPIGTAAADEPAPGTDLDLLVLGPGLLAIVLLVLAGAAGTAWLSVRRPGAAPNGVPSSVAAAAAGAHLPVPVLVGARFALEPGRGPAAVPVRPALLGAVAGVLGVVAAFTFSAGVSDAAANPARFGLTWQLETWMGFGGADFAPAGLLPAAARDREVAAVNDWRAAVATDAASRLTVLLYSYHPVGRPVDVVLESGRLPRTATEIVLAPALARSVHATVGGTVTMRGTTGRPLRLTVTGIGYVPAGSHCAGCTNSSGGWVSDAGFDALFTRFQFHGGFVAVRPGADVAAVAARLQRLGPPRPGPDLFSPPYPPFPATAIQQVRPFPLALAGFLTLLAAAAVAHAVALAVRRRGHDLAVLRALGMTPRQSRAVLLTQASVQAAVGLLFGVPLGVAAGRVLWRVVADYTPLQYQAPLTLPTLALIGPLALLLAGLLAAWPGHRAARLRIGQVLRAE